MQRDLPTLRQTEFDLVVIGGGITGACLAHDAALRGLRVALIERGDFGAATSSASSKLIHGGVRYLQHVQFGKVRESAQERGHFQVIAPHLTRYIPFLVPTYRNLARGQALLRAGMALYGLLATGTERGIRDPVKRLPLERFHSRRELDRLVPELASDPDVTGAYVLYESHIYSSERMTLAFLKTAVRNGALVCNYASVVDFLREGHRITGVRVRDELSGTCLDVRARLVANAAGPWIVQLNHRLSLHALDRNVVDFAKGAHIVTRQLIGESALVLSTKKRIRSVIHRGGRHLFVIPWRKHSLIGTTNTPFRGDLDDVRVTEEDVSDLIDDVNAALPGVRLTPQDVRYAFAGLYPLTDAATHGVFHMTGRYQVVDHAERGGVEGLISVLGVRYTTARRVAEHAVDLAFRKLGRPVPPCRTATTPIEGGAIQDLASFRREALERYQERLDGPAIEHLVNAYGTEIDAVVASSPQGNARLHRLSSARESIEAEVAFAGEHEMAVRLEDVVFRRTGIGTLGYPGRACLKRCATIMAEVLNWSEARVGEEVDRVVRLFRRLPPSLQPHD